jgi:hypothetical protein
MGISIDAVVGRGTVFYSQDKINSFIKHLNPNYEMVDEDDLEVCLYELGLLDNDLDIHYVGNCVTSKDQGTFIEVLSEKGEDILKAFGEQIVDVKTVCIM